MNNIVTFDNYNQDIVNLHNIFDNLFINYKQNNYYEPVLFNHNFIPEVDTGFIEYKRTLVNYNTKIDKLLRQIYWRLSESFYYSFNFCYYVIGLDNSGIYSNINHSDLEISLQIIIKTIHNRNINLKYIYLFNKNFNSYIIICKLFIDNSLVNLFIQDML